MEKLDKLMANEGGVDDKARPGEISTGTTIMAVTYDGGVLIGADSRTSSGAYIVDRAADKIDLIHDKIFCLRSGSAADT